MTALARPASQNLDTGECEIVIADEFFIGDSSGCLYWPAENCLILADLHLEKASSYALRGQLLPPHETGMTLRLLAERLAYWEPENVIALGDSFHDRKASERLGLSDRALLSSLVAGRQWTWISGNHDPEPPADIGGKSADELVAGGIVFRHEPSHFVSCNEISGHLHPQARIIRRGKSVRRRCFVTDGDRLVMPAFGTLTGGLNVRNRAFHGLFDPYKLHAHVIGRSDIYRISADQLV
ncbi:MAG: ligase-associated DNA damage response endonuclease PdeM [Pseudomonadota bacterium]